uniref:Peptidase S1 domain-containing protein n=1 Tax=Timema tahoe TaxID=61484 RepID=A0A7R9FH91_9NEOP|nr:unnamed protein product [Timema tahoe]
MQGSRMLRVLAAGAILLWVPPPATPHRTLQQGHSYKIDPKPCSVDGTAGTCMFVYECIKSEGRHIGMCVDTFMFGSCCVHNATDNTLLPPLLPSNLVSLAPSVLYSPPDMSTKPSLRPPAGPPRPTGGISSSHTTVLLPVSSGTQFSRPPTGNSSSNGQSYRPPQGGSSSNGQSYRPPQGGSSSNGQSYRPPQGGSSSNGQSYRPPQGGSSNNGQSYRPPQGGSSSNSTTFVTRPTGGSSAHNTIASSSAQFSRPPEDDSSSSTQQFALLPQSGSNNIIELSRPPQGINSSSTFVTRPTGGSTISTHNTIVINTQFTRPPYGGSSSSATFVTRPTGGSTTPTHNTIVSSISMSPILMTKPADSTTTSMIDMASGEDADSMASGSTAVISWTALQSPSGSSWHATTEPSFVTRPRPPSGGRPRPPQRPRPPSRPVRPTTTIPSRSTTTTTPASTTTARRRTTTTTTTPTTPTTSTPSSRDTTATSSLPATSTLATNSPAADKGGRCGVAPLFPRPETRIVGGKNSPFGGWPWQVSVRRTSFFGFSSTHRCGGALLNENWVATAGHCVDDLLTSQIRIRVGEYDFSSVQEPYPFVERSVGQKMVHPKYNFFTYEYDLALVKLEAPLEFQPHIAPICLPASDDLLIGENATVTGWGRLSEGGTLPSVLQQVSVPIVSNDKCKMMFLRAGRHEFIPEIFMCAGYETGGQDSCQGDSGGPLQVRGKDGRYFLAGIISWGIGCAEQNLPGVCTRISKFVPWILEHVT